MIHIPVLLKETIEILNPQPGEFFIDGTIGSGGHALEILKKIGPKGKLLGVDWDRNAIANCELLIADYKNAILVNDNYANTPEILKKNHLPKADGLLIDLGFSSESLESGRGFTFQKDEPLDMHYNIETRDKGQGTEMTAAEVVNSFSEKDLAEIFWKYGEERFSRQIAKKIIEERKIRPIKTTFDLVEIIKKAIPPSHRYRHSHRQIHPATRIFQALRIYVNHELENLEKLLKNLNNIVKGRIAIISYHSLEDRLVKNYFRELKNQGKAEILTKKPIRPTNEEIQANPRSRSAKLRALSM
jgi:16S rRNA (cytosine1402-N4)-methyltransferase